VRLRAGHLWVYRNEIARLDGQPADGDAVAVLTASGRSLGTGLLNTRSLIAVRLFTSADRVLDEAFFRARLESALALRARIAPGASACRSSLCTLTRRCWGTPCAASTLPTSRRSAMAGHALRWRRIWRRR